MWGLQNTRVKFEFEFSCTTSHYYITRTRIMRVEQWVLSRLNVMSKIAHLLLFWAEVQVGSSTNKTHVHPFSAMAQDSWYRNISSSIGNVKKCSELFIAHKESNSKHLTMGIATKTLNHPKAFGHDGSVLRLVSEGTCFFTRPLWPW